MRVDEPPALTRDVTRMNKTNLNYTPSTREAGGVSEQANDITLLLVYLLLDESVSMTGGPIEAINRALPELLGALVEHPSVSGVMRVSIIAFSEQAETLVELSDLVDLKTIPGLSPKSSTKYGAAFSHLRRTIETDGRRPSGSLVGTCRRTSPDPPHLGWVWCPHGASSRQGLLSGRPHPDELSPTAQPKHPAPAPGQTGLGAGITPASE